jgi:hypothetical protein
MAIVIKADCPDCGVVPLGPPDLTVRVCTDDGSGAYCFRCAACGSAVSHVATPDVCELLVSAGVERVEWRFPDELQGRPGGPRFTTDDLLDFHLQLRHDADVSAAIAALSSGANHSTS